MPAESKLKAECGDYVRHALNGRLVNLKALSWNGFPDSVMLVPNLPPVFIEFKAHGEKPRKNQIKWGGWLTKGHFKYWIVDDWGQFLVLVNILMEESK